MKTWRNDKRGVRKIILLEQTPYWEAELRRRFPGIGEELIACRNLQEVQKGFKNHPGSILISGGVELTGELVLLAGELLERGVAAGIVVIRRSHDQEVEWVLREMGVRAVLENTYQSAAEIERICQLLRKTGEKVRGDQ